MTTCKHQIQNSVQNADFLEENLSKRHIGSKSKKSEALSFLIDTFLLCLFLPVYVLCVCTYTNVSMWVQVLCVCTYTLVSMWVQVLCDMWACECRYLRNAEESARVPGARVTGACEPPSVVLGAELWSARAASAFDHGAIFPAPETLWRECYKKLDCSIPCYWAERACFLVVHYP